MIDDIYDVQGTYEELESFTEAIERWDISAADQLPKYMKVCYEALLNFFADMEESLANKGVLYRLHYARDGFKVQVRAYFQEAKWCKEKLTPTMDEYMPVRCYTSFFMCGILSFVGLGEIVTEETMDWVFSDPKVLKNSALIGRLMNDLGDHKIEEKRQDVPTAVECYMQQYSVTKEEATVEITKQVNEAWEDLNKEWLSTSPIPKLFLFSLIMNFARTSELLYKGGEDVYTRSLLKGYIRSLFIESVSI